MNQVCDKVVRLTCTRIFYGYELIEIDNFEIEHLNA